MSDLINWLLEEGNPAVKYRTQTELLNQAGDKASVASWIFDKLPDNWFQKDGLWYCYYVTAIAECGLTYEDIAPAMLDKAFEILETKFDCSCSDFMLLTALAKMGFAGHKTVRNCIESLSNHILPDGGFLCLHRADKLNYVPKSCYKANLHALMFFAACHRNGVDISSMGPIVEYFMKRSLFYRSTDKSSLVLDSREGWRTIDTFYPFEAMRVGLQNVVQAFCALGYGNHPCLQEAWDILESTKDPSGKVFLKGTLTKSYLPKEKVGTPSKWVTFYTLLAERQRSELSD